MNLDLIKNNTKWEEAANSINSNFNKTNLELTKIAASSVKHKGYFTTEAALLAAQPSPKVGDNAYVGATYPGVVYICNTAGMWTATTTVPSPPAVNISEYYKKTETDAIVDAVESNITSLETDLYKEFNFENKIDEIRPNFSGSFTPPVSPITAYYGNKSGKWNPSCDVLNSIIIKNTVLGDLEIMFVVINNDNTYSVIHNQYIHVNSGDNTIYLSDIFYDFSNITRDITVFIKGSLDMIKYATFNENEPINIPEGNLYVVYDIGYIIGLFLNTTTYKTEIAKTVKTNKKRLDILEGSGSGFDLQNELLYNKNIIIPNGTWIIESTLSIPSGTTISGESMNSILQRGGNCETIFNIIGKENITLDGFQILGGDNAINVGATDKINSINNIINTNGIGTHNAIYIESSKTIKINGLNIGFFDGSAIDAMIIGPQYSNGSKFTNLNISNCYCGIRLRNGAEYSFVSNTNINNCLIGLHITSGNMILTGISSTANRVNCYIGAGGNDGHGTMSSCLFNHAEYISLLVYGITNGYTFNGCHVFDSEIMISESKGINYNCGILDCYITISGGTNNCVNSFTNNAFINSYGGNNPFTIINNTVTLLRNNYFINGIDSTSLNN